MTILGEHYEGVVELEGSVGARVHTGDGLIRYVPNAELPLVQRAPDEPPIEEPSQAAPSPAAAKRKAKPPAKPRNLTEP